MEADQLEVKEGGKKTVGAGKEGQLQAPRPSSTHMAMSLASPGVRSFLDPTSLAEKWSFWAGPGVIDVGLVVPGGGRKEFRVGTPGGQKVASKGQDGVEEHFPAGGRLQEGVWAVGRSLIWAAGVGRSLGRGEAGQSGCLTLLCAGRA